jgi:hypothetical protein
MTVTLTSTQGTRQPRAVQRLKVVPTTFTDQADAGMSGRR